MQWLFFFVLMLLGGSPAMHAREFLAEGSDLLMGVGTTQIARAGAVVAAENGVYSLYWNPAGLADLEHHAIAMTGQLHRSLAHVGFFGAAFVLPTDERWGVHSVLGFSYVPRAHFTARGKFKEGELETTFVQVALPGLSGGFDGDLQSKTNDYRIGLGLRWDRLPDLSIGASVGRVRCHTLFTGYRTRSVGWVSSEITARATSIDLGAQYRLNDNLTLGIAFKNLHSELASRTVTTERGITSAHTSITPFIKDVTVGLNYRYSPEWEFGLVYQTLFGQYGNDPFDIKLLRASATYHGTSLDYHVGLIAPITMRTDVIKDFKLPAPAMSTVGISYETGPWSLGATMYIHPIMSLTTRTIRPAVDVSVGYRF